MWRAVRVVAVRRPRRFLTTHAEPPLPAGTLATQRKRSSAVVALGASAGVLLIALVGGVLAFPLMEAALPHVLRWTLIANSKKRDPVKDKVLASPHDPVDLRADELNALVKKLQEYDDAGAQGVVIVNGPPGTGKSSIARRLLVASGRPGLYVSFRACHTVQDVLYCYLYHLFEPVGVVGKVIIAYVKIVNAVLDLWAMNQGHEHVSAILTQQFIGHTRLAMLDMARRNDTPVPVFILDDVQVFLRTAGDGKEHTPSGEALHALNFLCASVAVDDATGHVVILGDHSLVGDAFGDPVTAVSPSATSPLFTHMPDLRHRAEWLSLPAGYSRERAIALLDAANTNEALRPFVPDVADGLGLAGCQFSVIKDALVTLSRSKPSTDLDTVASAVTSAASARAAAEAKAGAVVSGSTVPVGEVVSALATLGAAGGVASAQALGAHGNAGLKSLVACGLVTPCVGPPLLAAGKSGAHPGANALYFELEPSLRAYAASIATAYTPVSLTVVAANKQGTLASLLTAALTVWMREWTPEELSRQVVEAVTSQGGKIPGVAGASHIGLTPAMGHMWRVVPDGVGANGPLLVSPQAVKTLKNGATIGPTATT